MDEIEARLVARAGNPGRDGGANPTGDGTANPGRDGTANPAGSGGASPSQNGSGSPAAPAGDAGHQQAGRSVLPLPDDQIQSLVRQFRK